MPRTRDWIPGNLVQVLAFGRYKVGKTWGALTFPRPNVMDFDRGIATARNPNFVKQHGMRDIIYEQFTDKVGRGGIPLTHDAFDGACRYFDEWMAPAKRDQFDTWVVDSGTTLSNCAMHKAVILLGGSKLSIKSETHKEAKAYGVVIPRIQDYGAERSMMEQFVFMVRDSGKHVVMICHEKDLTNKQGDTIATVPLLTGRSIESIPIMFDEVWNIRAKPEGTGRKFYIQTMPDGLRNLGSRYGVPDGIKFEWDTINQALNTIRAIQLKQATEAREAK